MIVLNVMLVIVLGEMMLMMVLTSHVDHYFDQIVLTDCFDKSY